MKKNILIYFVIIFITACSGANDGRISAEVIRVIDGDTIEVLLDGKEETVRFLLIDTPETRHPQLGVQPYGQEASAFVHDLLQGETVELEFDGSERDKYGRLLMYVYIDGESVQEMLLRKGLARVAYVYPPNTKYVDRYREIQAEAQKKAIGIWSIENYVQEDGFQSEFVEQENVQSSDCNIKGNLSSSGDKIYHVPGGAHYEVTKPEQWFCSEEEAKAAGFRPAQR